MSYLKLLLNHLIHAESEAVANQDFVICVIGFKTNDPHGRVCMLSKYASSVIHVIAKCTTVKDVATFIRTDSKLNPWIDVVLEADIASSTFWADIVWDNICFAIGFYLNIAFKVVVTISGISQDVLSIIWNCVFLSHQSITNSVACFRSIFWLFRAQNWTFCYCVCQGCHILVSVHAIEWDSFVSELYQRINRVPSFGWTTFSCHFDLTFWSHWQICLIFATFDAPLTIS